MERNTWWFLAQSNYSLVLHVITYLSKLIECTTPRVNPNVNYGLLDIPLLWEMLIIERLGMFGGGENIEKIAVLSHYFVVNPKML
jgi:hypothetical protein